MSKYGELQKVIAKIEITFSEMMFYQYLPIKLVDNTDIRVEKRLQFLESIIGTACCDFIGAYGLNRFVNSYVYLTVKHQYVSPSFHFNRLGWHSDGFMTEDINYIWSDKIPTVFNTSPFLLPMDDVQSIICMESQALPKNDVTFEDCTLLRLNEFNIHRVGDVKGVCLRSFIKISFSKDVYDLKGNSINYELNYNWDYRERGGNRNIPQKLIV
jgi:hypothetical protein